MSPFNALKHLVYFEELAVTEEASPSWNSTTAGLVVLRLLDSWYDFGPGAIRENGRGVKNIKAAVEAIEDGNVIRNILGGLLDAIERAKPRDVSNILPRLMAYGRALDYDGKWNLSHDVFQTVLDYANVDEDADVVVDAHMQMGYCMRMSGHWDEAAYSYAQAGQIASASNDMERVLRARIADAKLAIDRGNLPMAAALLDDTISQAQASEEFIEVRSIALHDRAAVAHMKGEYESAIKFGHDALNIMRNPVARDRVLADIATSFGELGVLSAARDALVIVAATAQETYLRWVAEINLLEIASKQGAEPAFERYRRDLADVDLPAALRTHYYLHLGRGYQLFGRMEEARTNLNRALTLASENKFNKVLFEVEQSIKDLDAAPKVTDRKDVETTPEVTAIAREISEMRENAGIAV